MITYMDTLRVEEIKNELSNLSNEYNEIITELFQKLTQVPFDTKEWVGNRANYYFSTILPDKSKFLEYGNNLRNIVNKLEQDYSEVTGNVLRISRVEEEARYNDQI